MIIYKSSHNDTKDALELKILKSDEFLLSCLEQAGLNTKYLSDAAKKFIIKSYRETYPKRGVLIKSINDDAIETFKPFINQDGNYQVPGKLVLVPHKNKSYRVLDKDIVDGKICYYRRSFSSEGIEIRRIIIGEDEAKKEVYERQDLVKINYRLIDIASNSVRKEEQYFINPLANKGKDLEVGEIALESPVSSNTITTYLQSLTGLDPRIYSSNGEIKQIEEDSRVE